MDEKISTQADYFKNRLVKKYKHLVKWIKRKGISCCRLYDKDIPEIPIIVDIYTDFRTSQIFSVVSMYKRPYVTNSEDEEKWLNAMLDVLVETLNIDKTNIYLKTREKQSGNNQYTKKSTKNIQIIVKEDKALFHINLSDYLDTGLFLDHRLTRIQIGKIIQNKTLLNLFCYTGSFSVHAAINGAKNTTSVDLSKTYLKIAQENFILNHLSMTKNELINADVFEFLNLNKQKKWDVIVCDPPTFSNSKKTTTILDINKDWCNLIVNCLSVLSQKGVLYFSTNSRKLKFEIEKLQMNAISKLNKNIYIKDITSQSLDEDFKNSKIHRLWKIQFI